MGERALPMGAPGCSSQADAGAHAACAAHAGKEGECGVRWVNAPGARLGAATIATTISSAQACPWQPAGQPAGSKQQGTAASCSRPSVGAPYGSGSGGRHRGGVGSGMGRRRPSRLATAAASGTGESRQLVRYVWHVGWSSQGTTAAQAVPCQTSTDDPHKHSLKRARMAWLSLASCME